MVNNTPSEEENICRICLSGAQDLQNPLISPCNCSGSGAFIHLGCLKQWIESKRTMKLHKDQVVVRYKKLECELCKKIFPYDYFDPASGASYTIVDLEHPESDYLILESLKEENSKSKFIINK